MTRIRDFVRRQVELAQAQLQDLLLLHPDKAREDVVPELILRDVRDDPTIQKRAWSFLDDPRNQALQGKDRWILNRVLDHDWLREEFFLKQQPAQWRRPAVA